MITHVAATLLLGMAQGSAPPLLRVAMEQQPAAPPVILPAPAPSGPPARIAVHARPRIALSSLVIDDDYPIEALRAESEGTVEFVLDIGSNGRVTDCRISRSSGSAALEFHDLPSHDVAGALHSRNRPGRQAHAGHPRRQHRLADRAAAASPGPAEHRPDAAAGPALGAAAPAAAADELAAAAARAPRRPDRQARLSADGAPLSGRGDCRIPGDGRCRRTGEAMRDHQLERILSPRRGNLPPDHFAGPVRAGARLGRKAGRHDLRSADPLVARRVAGPDSAGARDAADARAHAAAAAVLPATAGRLAVAGRRQGAGAGGPPRFDRRRGLSGLGASRQRAGDGPVHARGRAVRTGDQLHRHRIERLGGIGFRHLPDHAGESAIHPGAGLGGQSDRGYAFRPDRLADRSCSRPAAINAHAGQYSPSSGRAAAAFAAAGSPAAAAGPAARRGPRFGARQAHQPGQQ